MTISDELALAAVDLAVANQDTDTLDRIAAQLDIEDGLRLVSLPVAAIAYAEQGIPVFPLRVGEKRPATRNGFKDATCDPERVHAWWSENPAYNIGFPTGHLFDVIDVDGPPGYASLADLLDDGLIPETLGKVSTARGGRHLYITPTGDGNTAGLRPGIDYRGLGGYVVAPPSLSASQGRRWMWIEAWKP